jgi:hypothetical protein
MPGHHALGFGLFLVRTGAEHGWTACPFFFGASTRVLCYGPPRRQEATLCESHDLYQVTTCSGVRIPRTSTALSPRRDPCRPSSGSQPGSSLVSSITLILLPASGRGLRERRSTTRASTLLTATGMDPAALWLVWWTCWSTRSRQPPTATGLNEGPVKVLAGRLDEVTQRVSAGFGPDSCRYLGAAKWMESPF